MCACGRRRADSRERFVEDMSGHVPARFAATDSAEEAVAAPTSSCWPRRRATPVIEDALGGAGRTRGLGRRVPARSARDGAGRSCAGRGCSSTRERPRSSNRATSSWASTSSGSSGHVAGELGEVVLGRVDGRTSDDEITDLQIAGHGRRRRRHGRSGVSPRDRDRRRHRIDVVMRDALVPSSAHRLFARRRARHAGGRPTHNRGSSRERAFDAAYNLDHAEAIAFLDKAIAADPNDADAHRAVAVIAWLRIGFLRGSITVDDYLGSVTKPNINMLPPPPDEAAAVSDATSPARWSSPKRRARTAARSGRALPDRLHRRRAGFVWRHGRGQDPGVVSGRAPRLRCARKGAGARSLAQGRRARSSAPIATSCRRSRCRCG